MNEELKISKQVCARVPTEVGEFSLCLYTNNKDNKEHLAFVMGDVWDTDSVLVRIHSECFTGDVLGSQRCDCGEQLHRAMKLIADEGAGIILYLRQEGRGIGLEHKLQAYNLQDNGLDTIDANLALGLPVDDRDYSMAAAMLQDLGIKNIRLITNNPRKMIDLQQRGFNVIEQVPVLSTVYPGNESYLRTKVERMKHTIQMQDAQPETTEQKE